MRYVAALLFLSELAFAAHGDERALWQLWLLHTGSPDNHAAVIAAARPLQGSEMDPDVRVVANGVAAWHAARAGRTNDAIAAWSDMLTRQGDSPAQTGDRIARTWLSLFDMESLRPVLRNWYLKHVTYPASLSDLASGKGQSVPLQDRWGRDWGYGLTGFRQLKGFHGQRYRLFCTRLGRDVTAATALARPWPTPNIEPVRVISAGYRTGTVVFRDAARKEQTLSVGMKSGDTTFAMLGAHLIVLADTYYWYVLPRPRNERP